MASQRAAGHLSNDFKPPSNRLQEAPVNEPKSKSKPEASFRSPPLRVASTRPGFWRCGRQWSTTPTDVPAGHFSAEELARLKADQTLVVVELPTAADGQ